MKSQQNKSGNMRKTTEDEKGDGWVDVVVRRRVWLVVSKTLNEGLLKVLAAGRLWEEEGRTSSIHIMNCHFGHKYVR
jgi:hypothetical protein